MTTHQGNFVPVNMQSCRSTTTIGGDASHPCWPLNCCSSTILELEQESWGWAFASEEWWEPGSVEREFLVASWGREPVEDKR